MLKRCSAYARLLSPRHLPCATVTQQSAAADLRFFLNFFILAAFFFAVTHQSRSSLRRSPEDSSSYSRRPPADSSLRGDRGWSGTGCCLLQRHIHRQNRLEIKIHLALLKHSGNKKQQKTLTTGVSIPLLVAERAGGAQKPITPTLTLCKVTDWRLSGPPPPVSPTPPPMQLPPITRGSAERRRTS